MLGAVQQTLTSVFVASSPSSASSTQVRAAPGRRKWPPRRRRRYSRGWPGSEPSPSPAALRPGSWTSSASFTTARSRTPAPFWHLVVAVEKLAGNGAKMVIISNSSRRSSVTMDKLKSLGFDTSCFLATITSGELTHQHLLKRNDPWFAALGRKCIHITWGNRGAISLEGLGLQVVNNVDDAEFILAHGTEALGSPSGDPLPKSLEELEQVLMLGLERRLPMVVANPDYVTVEARDLRVMPGTLAAKYENLGGEVKWMGKPDKVIYNSAMSLAGVGAHECIMVGDSLHHDIKGANASGIASAFITGGIHAAELGLGESGETAGEDAVNTLCSKHGSYPSYVLPSFTW
ncbi:uncharacterized protein LOC120678876 isoform X3 [Panicum virgatum]|uniref:uncharacterized protein LOC120678876 isoform X3 n=1 Tax=Panicum virgatum TaxID=38727 RepID=UPI0019D5D815|nr:uncharacterized protein LOC120678876 isoform X3 [Panicum virgatum]